MGNQTTARARLIEAINSPLGFFVLALLIVEGFLGAVMLWAKLDISNKMICIYMGVGLFVILVIVVSILVWYKPTSLTYDREAHLVEKQQQRIDKIEKNVEVNSYLSTGLTLVQAYDNQKDIRTLIEAEIAYNQALKINPNIVAAYIGLGKIKKRYSFFGKSEEDKKSKLNEAIDYCKKAIAINKYYDVPYYNIACYKILLGLDTNEALKDLENAIKLEPANRELAKGDPDFSFLAENEGFKKLVGS